jgi:outer membrane receptor for monomeric catechols
MSPTPCSRSALTGLVSLLVLFPAAAPAQIAPAASGPAPANTDAVTVQLSVFEVSADKDVGYQAGNTTSGSRLNSSLKDTAAAVMVFTPEFLADFGATSLADIVAYSPNMAVDMLDTAADANPQFLGGSDLRDTRIRVRGLSASTALDFFETATPIDTYNTERVELSSGPNSILFGFGSPGGLVNIMTKRAHTARNRTALRTQFGQWRYHRAELDHNQVIVPGKIALRLNGLYQNSGGWRKYDFNDATRGAVSLRLTPFKSTTIVANYENGQVRAHVTRPVNAFDALALWTARGAPTKSDAAWVAADRANGINRNTVARTLYVTDADGSAPFALTLSNAANLRLLESTYEDLNTPVNDRAGLTLLPRSVMPFDYSGYGPGSDRDHNFDRLVATVEQRVTRDLTLEFAYNREGTGQLVRSIQSNLLTFAGDPNTTIPNPNGTATSVANPNAGGLYMEGRWVSDFGETTNDVFRGSAAWDLDLGKFGRHKLAGMAEHGTLRSCRYPIVQILVDERGVPFSNAATPENAANFVWRRHYVTPGNFGTYYAGRGPEDFTVARNSRTYRPAWINANANANGGDIERTMQTLLAATQSSFWQNKIVVTAGVRWDRITFDSYGDARLAATHPDVVAGRAIANTVRFTSTIDDTTIYEPVTSTQGLVFHATRLLSVFYNHANNNAQPPLNARVLPDERLPPPFEGVSDDYGFMLNLLDGKIFLRATAYKTAQDKASGGTFAIGLNSGENNLVAPSTRILDTLLAAGRITQAQYTQHLIGDEANLTGASDVRNEGYELSTWFNVTKNLTGVLNFSYTKTDRSSIVPEFEGWFARESAFWRSTPGAGSLVNPVSNATIDQEAASLQRVMTGIREFCGFGYGERPYKINASGRYAFTEGRLKGAFLGGGARWSSEPKLGRKLTGRTADGLRILGDTIYGPVDFKLDAFVGYRGKVGGLRRNAEFTVQLNVTNLSDEDEVMPLRYNPTGSGYLRVLLYEPRKFRLTAGLSF